MGDYMEIENQGVPLPTLGEGAARLSRTRYEALITNIYQGFLEASPWQSFLRLLREITDSDIASLMLRPGKPGERSLTLWDCAAFLPQETLEAARADQMQYDHLNPLVTTLIRTGGIFTLDQVISRTELVKTDFYNKLMLHYRLEHMVTMHFQDARGAPFFLGLINSPEKSNFTDFHKDLLLSLRPHIEYAMTAYNKITSEKSEKDVYSEALNRLSLGTIILDGCGKVLDMNAAAAVILQRSSCISLNKESLVVARPKFREEFTRLVKGAIAWHEKQLPDTYAEALRIECIDGNDVGVLIRSAPPSPWRQKQGEPSVIVHLEDFGQDESAPEQVVARLFGLTRSEARLAAMLASGFTLIGAAAKLGLTESSVRTYSKKIFAKMGVRRQAELVGVIKKSVAMLARPTPVPMPELNKVPA